MGYGYYEIGTPEEPHKLMKRGYTVRCKCHKRGCHQQIDRGLAYLCYRCTQYFCGNHLTMAVDSDDRALRIDCFAGESSQVCFTCAKIMEQKQKERSY